MDSPQDESHTTVRPTREHKGGRRKTVVEEVDRKAGFHDREEDFTTEGWKVREVIRAIKDEEIDKLLRG